EGRVGCAERDSNGQGTTGFQCGVRFRHVGRELLEASRSNTELRSSTERDPQILGRVSLPPAQCHGPQPVHMVEVSEGRLRPRSAAGGALTGRGNDVGALGVPSQPKLLLHHRLGVLTMTSLLKICATRAKAMTVAALVASSLGACGDFQSPDLNAATTQDLTGTPSRLGIATAAQGLL